MRSPVIPERHGHWWVAATVLLLIGVGCLGVGLHSTRRALPGPVATQEQVTTASPTSAPPTVTATTRHRPRAANAPIARSRPVLLSIPAIGVSVSLSELGLNADKTVQVPTDFQQPGWFHRGPSPGQNGSAVILGHVDSYKGPAVFFRIRELEQGDKVDVRLADGAVAHFVVRTVAMYAKKSFPARLVYGSHRGSELQIVTCGGTFDPGTGHYLSNIVAYTSLVSTTPARK